MEEKPLPAVQPEVQQNTTPTIKELEVQLTEKNPKVFEGVSNTKKNRILKALRQNIERFEVMESVTHTQSSLYSGPIPHPEIMKEYIEINPDFADRIFTWTEDEQKYSQNRDNKIIEKSFDAKKRGQNYALIIALTAIVGGIICILFDHEIAGGIVSGVGLTGLVAEFLDRPKLNEKKDSPRKALVEKPH